MNEIETLLTVEDTAHILGVKPGTIYDWVAKGILPHVRILAGRKRPVIRFRQPDLDTFICDRIEQGRLVPEKKP